MPLSASDTQNIKLGVCNITFGGDDFGLTKGGVEVEIQTTTHPVTVDQFGETLIKEYITGRKVVVKVPLVESTLDRLKECLPGSTLVTNGTKATGTLTVATNPSANDTIILGGVTLTFKTSVSVVTDVLIGATAAATAANIAATINTAVSGALTNISAAVAGAVVTLTAKTAGTGGNSFALSAGTAGVKVTVSGATMTGGTGGSGQRLDVAHANGIELRAVAKVLKLHPSANAVNDKSEDFIVPLAMTPGNFSFAYKVDEERVYNVEFSGYPNQATGVLFQIGDDSI